MFPSSEKMSDWLRETLERYDESLLRQVATRLCKPRNQWPAEELIDASIEARDIIAQARRLRQQLRNMGPKAPSCIVDRIVSVALERDPPSEDFSRLRN